ncbi:GTPase IMAP family member 5-like [Sorex araneus]|uniref:GTPase IMAP family member 5-like n=1 Tax=Sorex araneus TaxID=42254 RepID=UPI0024336346|nr:GTPase IMAP family member 5-like [Sorex araneus]
MLSPKGFSTGGTGNFGLGYVQLLGVPVSKPARGPPRPPTTPDGLRRPDAPNPGASLCPAAQPRSRSRSPSAAPGKKRMEAVPGSKYGSMSEGRRKQGPSLLMVALTIAGQCGNEELGHSRVQTVSSGSRAGAGIDASSSLRIVLVGKSGSGKSATGNSILCRPEFESHVAGQSVTRQCQEARGTWEGRSILVVDTPPIFDAGPPTQDLYKNIGDCYLLSAPGPHVLLLVTQLGRFTAHDAEAVRRVKEVFGLGAMRHVIVLFTHKEDLQGEPLADYLASVRDSGLPGLLRECGRRFCGFNNRATGAEQRRQLAELMGQVESLERELQGGFLSNELSREAQLLLQQRSAGAECVEQRARFLGLVRRELEKQRRAVATAPGSCHRARLCRNSDWVASGISALLITCILIFLAILIYYGITRTH